MFDPADRERVLGVSPPVGIALMVVIVVVLATLVAVLTTDVTRSTRESARVHAVGTFDVEFESGGGDSLRIASDALRNEDTTFVLEVNDNRVYRWDGHEPLEFTFGIDIDPDGPGPDSTMGNAVAKRDIGTVPVTNHRHYVRRYDKPVEGFSPPVWVVVMTDNVHWDGVGGGNWTDDPSGEPGVDSYSVRSTGSGNDLKLDPSGSEPTNDIYMMFKPGRSGSDLKIVDVSAGYHNRVYVNDRVAIPDTCAYSTYNSSASATPVTLAAPGVNCPAGP